MYKAIVRDSDNRVVAINGAGHGHKVVRRDIFSIVPIPDQDVDQFYVEVEGGPDELKEIYLDDLENPDDWSPPKTTEERIKNLEKATGTGKKGEKGIANRIDGLEERIEKLEE